MSDRLRRLLLVVPAARARPGISIAELAAELACDPKELRADIELLAYVGRPPFQPDDLIDIELRGDQVWVSLPLGFDRPARLLATEAGALALAARTLAPNDPVARAAVEKLEKAVLPAQRELYNAFAERIAPAPPDAPEDVARLLQQACADRREIEIDYTAASDRTTRPRVVRPRVVITVNGLRYLSAQNGDGGERTYRLDRIAQARLTARRFDPLPAISAAALTDRIARFEQSGDLPRATLHFVSSAAEAARARHPDARSLTDGGVEVDLPYSTMAWLVSYVFSWGGQAVVKAPLEAREAMARAIDEASKGDDAVRETR